jgi:hypothetical protein
MARPPAPNPSTTRAPLQRAALELVPPSATASDHEERLPSAGVAPSPGLADGLLDDLGGSGSSG